MARVQRLPGVQSAGAVSLLPLGGQNSSGTTTIDTRSVPVEDTTPEADQRVVTPDYFKAMGISLVRGRFFEDRDTDGARPSPSSMNEETHTHGRQDCVMATLDFRHTPG